MRREMQAKKFSLKIFILCFVVVFVFGFGCLTATAVAKEPGDPAQKQTDQTASADPEKKDVPGNEKEIDTPLFYQLIVTATGTMKDMFETPSAVSVVKQEELLQKVPNNITDLLVDMPGMDVAGVGTNQSRPVIRGLRGQRILLLEDGIRMNNPRRQQNFGEIPAMIDISSIERVEVVRGPASVLYGSDAIGGVVNIITKAADYDPKESQIHGNIGYRYSSADKQSKGNVGLNGNIGRLGILFNGSLRDASEYTAPAGTFGNIHLQKEAVVKDSGVKDGNADFTLNYLFAKDHQVSFKYEYYKAQDAGFGFIEPALYDPKSPRIQIQYPMQTVNKYTLKYENRLLHTALADHIAFTVFKSSNERDLDMDVFVNFNIPNRPTAGVSVVSQNYTDVDTDGFRLEFNKAIKTHILTYGMDFFQDKTRNTDTSTTQVIGFGPPRPTVDNTPLIPNARCRSIGAFIQDDIPLFKRTSLILGVRYQSVNAKTRETQGIKDQTLYNSTDQTFVGAANIIYGITEHLRLVVSLGRGFRSPNLIERFFYGMTPEGSGFQTRNTGLKAETNFNYDLGFKYRNDNVYFESSYFHNIIRDGIRLSSTGRKVNGVSEYQNVNVDKLRLQGFEALGKIFFKVGLSFTANYTHIKSKDLGNPETPYTDTYSSKLNLNARYDNPGKLFWAEYDLRINGDQKDIELGINPIGDIIPGFTIHSFSAGITLFRNSRYPQQVGIIIANLTNELYSEFSNASFFRPAAKRQIVLTWNGRF